MQMNEGQIQAIRQIDGQLIIVACPGSGKTTTLLNRIHYMTEAKGIDPSSILMLTFSKAAADEMKRRYKDNFDSETAVYFGTIHAFCLALIKKFKPEEFRDGIISDYDVNDFFMKKINRMSNIGNKADFVNELRLDIGKFNNSFAIIGQYEPACCKNKNLFYGLLRNYEEYKQSVGKIDYDDMLFLAYEILKYDDNALSWIRDRYRYVLVDEYQDVSELQKRIIYQIAGKDGNLAVVGDDDQSIYGFRGADASIMLNFKKDYPDSELIYLKTNYRSNEEIVEKSSQLIKHNRIRFDKEFLSNRGAGGKVEHLSVMNRKAEIDLLLKDIVNQLESGMNPDEIAVIYRVNKQGTLLAEALMDKEITFKTNDKISGIYDHWIYNDILAFYRMATGMGSKYDFWLTLNHPNRYLYDEGIKNCGPDENRMIRVIRARRTEAWKKDSAIKEVKDYFKLLTAIKSAKGPGAVIRTLITKGKYRNYLSEYADYRNEDLSMLNSILDQLLAAAENSAGWAEWEEEVKCEKMELEKACKSSGGITLTTMHSAKGLEWKLVYIIDCIEGINPYIKAKSASEMEEERRLFYVAMTRAKDRLIFMSYKNTSSGQGSISRFLSESGIAKEIKGQIRTRHKIKSSYAENSSYYEGEQADRLSGGEEIPEIAVGDRVNTRLYGKGVITDIIYDSAKRPKKFTVNYTVDGDKSYIYPAAFAKGMTKAD